MGNKPAFGFVKDFQDIPTCRWEADARKWTEWSGGGQPSRQSTLKALTWNVLRTDAFQADFLHELRIPALIQQLEAADADVLALQEVTKPFLDMLLRQDWVRENYYLAGPPEMLQGQKLRELLLSKLPPMRSIQLHWSAAKRPTGMQWLLNGEVVTAISLHLPSDQSRQAPEKRRIYLGELEEALGGRGASLLLGDFNLSGEAPLGRDFADVWRLLRPNDAGFTFHTGENPLAEAIAGAQPPARFDRMYLHSPQGKAIPKDISLMGVAPSPIRGYEVWPSDHFGLLAEFETDVTYRSLREARPVRETALAFVPDPAKWAAVQAIRRDHDDRFHRWMPHVNLLYGFLPESHFKAAAVAIHLALAEHAPFMLSLSQIEQFENRDSTTVWLGPDEEGAAKLRDLHAALVALFPNCKEQDVHGDFVPHLSLGRFPGRHRAYAAGKRVDWRKAWEGLLVEVDCLCLLARSGKEPFRVVEAIPLGGEQDGAAALRRRHPAAWDLERSLGALGLLPGPVQEMGRAQTEKELAVAICSVDGKCQFHSVGLSGLGIGVAVGEEEAVLEYIGLGRLAPEDFARRLSDVIGGSRVRVTETEHSVLLRMRLGEAEVSLRYVAVPAGMQIRRPSSFGSSDFASLPEEVRACLALSLETAALRRILGPALPLFQRVCTALLHWLGRRPAAERVLDLRAWTLVLAAAPVEETAGRWLEGAFQFLLQHDFAEPICPAPDVHAAWDGSAVWILPPTFPQENAAPGLGEADREALLDLAEEALEGIWLLRQGAGSWVDFLEGTMGRDLPPG